MKPLQINAHNCRSVSFRSKPAGTRQELKIEISSAKATRRFFAQFCLVRALRAAGLRPD
jgi:hypothetical protein